MDVLRFYESTEHASINSQLKVAVTTEALYFLGFTKLHRKTERCVSPATGGVRTQPTVEESAENVTSDATASSRPCSGLVQCDGFKEGFELRQEGGSVSLSWSRLEKSPVNTQVLARQGWGESRGTNTHDVCDVHMCHTDAQTQLCMRCVCF